MELKAHYSETGDARTCTKSSSSGFTRTHATDYLCSNKWCDKVYWAEQIPGVRTWEIKSENEDRTA